MDKATPTIEKQLDPCEWPPKGPWPEVPLALPQPDLWVFGYGSLMWNPGFPPVESEIARIYGYHRGLCVWSWIYRGTERSPGLVLGLDAGGSCFGVAHRVRAKDRHAAVAYLFRREMVTRVYRPLVKSVRLDNGRSVEALTFVVDRQHTQYAGAMKAHEAAEVIRGARGSGGPNLDYVANTVHCLDRLGIPCRRLHRVHALLEETSS